MTPTIEVTTSLHAVNCGKCGGVYGITEAFRSQCYKNDGGWNCPYCRVGWGFFGDDSPLAQAHRKTEEANRRAERNDARACRLQDERDTAERRRRGEKAAKTRLRNKVAAGTCPSCGKKFPNLASHMAKRHPGFCGKAKK